MARVKRGVTAHAKHKKVLAQTKGHYGANNRLFKRARIAAALARPTPIVTAATASAISAACGSSASTPPAASTACPTPR